MTELAPTARLDILVEGYVRPPNVAGTVSLIRDADRVVVVDPGMVADRELILRPLRELGVRPEDVTDVVVSHHHLDHTLNIALFPAVPVHDFQSVIEGDVFTQRAAEGTHITPSIRLHATPGHTPQDITTLVGTADDTVALTHLWWTEEGPADDPYTSDREELRQQRERVLDLATLIVPGHGAPFRAGSSTPR
jgi:glyoxylase-like metal-dependent hydrolase (beta-lactamase superfamily II)